MKTKVHATSRGGHLKVHAPSRDGRASMKMDVPQSDGSVFVQQVDVRKTRRSTKVEIRRKTRRETKRS
jgi:hypothetical protein